MTNAQRPNHRIVTVKAEFDQASQSWWAEADIDEQNALTTGAPTLDELLDRIPIVLRDLLIDDYPATGRCDAPPVPHARGSRGNMPAKADPAV